MIFAVRQIMEKTRDMRTHCTYILFVDLKKAYNSVSRNALWSILQKNGVPPAMLNITSLFHEGMNVQVRVDSTNTDNIEVRNGLRQGCSSPPVHRGIIVGLREWGF